MFTIMFTYSKIITKLPICSSSRSKLDLESHQEGSSILVLIAIFLYN